MSGALGDDAKQPRLIRTVQRFGYAFQAEPLPLATVYVLGERSLRGDAPTVELLRGADALMALVTHSFANSVLDRTMRAHDLNVLSALASKVRIVRIIPGEGLHRVPELCDAILKYQASLKKVTTVATRDQEQ